MTVKRKGEQSNGCHLCDSSS